MKTNYFSIKTLFPVISADCGYQVLCLECFPSAAALHYLTFAVLL